MKKILLIIFAAALSLNLCACGDIVVNTSAPLSTPDVAKADAAGAFSPAPDILPAEDAASASPNLFVPTGAVEPTPAPTSTPAPTPAPTPVPPPTPAPVANVYVTKSPTSEHTLEGGAASFVAYAENSTGITWLLMDPGSGAMYDCSTVAYVLPGLYVSGANSACLTLGNLPTWMNGWYVQARFSGPGGPVHTDVAFMWVSPVSCAPPCYSPYTPPYPSYPIMPNGFPYIGG